MKYVLWPKQIKLKLKNRGFPSGSVMKNLSANAGGMGSIPGQGRSYLPCSKWAHVPQLLSLCSRAQTEKAMASHSSTLAWKIPWTEEPGKLQSMLRIRQTEQLHFHFSLSCIGEGNGNPLQCSCLENPRDREAWWAAVYGVAQSRTRLKWLSS